MKKKYITPELETVKFDLKDVILASILEETLPSVIGGDEGGGDEPIDIEGL